MNQIAKAIETLRSGGVIAYPTEAVYGLGCNPFSEEAVKQLFHVKQRPYEKGVILVAADISQIESMVQLSGEVWESNVRASWPGPVTWVLPIKADSHMPDWVTGGRDTVAIRVSDHPVVQQLCQAYGGPIVSTSANISSQPPAKSCEEVKAVFAEKVYCVQGDLGVLAQPTQIWDARSGQQLR